MSILRRDRSGRCSCAIPLDALRRRLPRDTRVLRDSASRACSALIALARACTKASTVMVIGVVLVVMFLFPYLLANAAMVRPVYAGVTEAG